MTTAEDYRFEEQNRQVKVTKTVTEDLIKIRQEEYGCASSERTDILFKDYVLPSGVVVTKEQKLEDFGYWLLGKEKPRIGRPTTIVPEETNLKVEPKEELKPQEPKRKRGRSMKKRKVK